MSTQWVVTTDEISNPIKDECLCLEPSCSVVFRLTNIDDLFRSTVDNLLIVSQGCYSCSRSLKSVRFKLILR